MEGNGAAWFRKQNFVSRMGQLYSTLPLPCADITSSNCQQPLKDSLHASCRQPAMHSSDERCNRLEAGQTAEVIIKRQTNKMVSWRCRKSNSEELLLGGLQLFSDELQTSLNPRQLNYNPLQVTLTSFSEYFHWSYITKGNTIIAYLPVRYNVQTNKRSEIEQKGSGKG